MFKNLKYQFILHFIVLIWGVTGILGDYINIPLSNPINFLTDKTSESFKIVFFRTLIASASLLIIGFFIKTGRKLAPKEFFKLLLIGFFIGIHWFGFFYAIKISTISIGVVCMSISTLFTSFLEPIFFKRKISVSEIIISFFILAGIIIIFGFEFQYVRGIIFGLISAFFAALFTVLNGKMIQTIPPFKITQIEMLGALLFSLGGLMCFNQVNKSLFVMSNTNWILLTILALVCTTFAFMVSVWVMKYVSPFTVSLSVNMEPVYTVIIAVLMNPLKEKMTYGFYIGGCVIILSIFTNAYFKKINRKKMLVI